MLDSVPTVFITGQVRTELLGTDGFQEADTFGITMPIVKHSVMIQDPRRSRARSTRRSTSPAPAARARCWSTSRRTSRGPTSTTSRSTDVHLPGYQPTTEGNQKQIRLAAKAMANARRPVIYAGGGVVNANASAELTELATVRPLPGHLHA